MLHYIGTTPGKLAMGIRIEYIQGGNLPMWAAMERSFSVWKNGTAFGIPIIELVAYRIHYCHLTGRAIWRGQKYNEIDPPMDMDWDTECELQYTDWEGKRIAAFICVLLVYLGLGLVVSSDTIKPKYRGDSLTLEQFAENYNASVRIFYENDSAVDKLQKDGTWTPVPNNTVVIHIGGEPKYEQAQLTYETEDGILRSITCQNSWTEVFYLQPISSECKNIAITVLLAQKNVGIQELEEFTRKLDTAIEQGQNSFRYQNIEVRWDVQYENCRYVGGILSSLHIDDLEQNNQGTASMTFKVIIHQDNMT